MKTPFEENVKISLRLFQKMSAFSFIMQYVKKHKFQYIAGIITDGLTDQTIDWNGVLKHLCGSAVGGRACNYQTGLF